MSIKILKNNTISDIVLKTVGYTILASDNYTIEVSEFRFWATPDVITEITPFINSGDITVNDGINDLSATDGIRYLKYPDRAYIQQDSVDVTRVNEVLNFEGEHVEVTDDGNGKATVTIGINVSDTLYWVSCNDTPGCEPEFTDIRFLMDHKLCYIKQEDC